MLQFAQHPYLAVDEFALCLLIEYLSHCDSVQYLDRSGGFGNTRQNFVHDREASLTEPGEVPQGCNLVMRYRSQSHLSFKIYRDRTWAV